MEIPPFNSVSKTLNLPDYDSPAPNTCSRSTKKRTVVNDVSVHVDTGEIVGLLGLTEPEKPPKHDCGFDKTQRR